MLTLKIEKGEWVAIGDSWVRFSHDCKIDIDAPNVPVMRGTLAKNRLKREVFEIVDSNGLNREATEQYKKALAFLCHAVGLQSSAAELGYPEPFAAGLNPMVAALANKFKLPSRMRTVGSNGDGK